MGAIMGLGLFEYTVVLAFVVAGILPYVSAVRGGTSVALATILSLLLVSFVQFSNSMILGVPIQLGFLGWPLEVFGSIPSISSSPFESYRMFTSAWMHGSWTHVLGNILVIGLVGIPLEQRMGGKRWMAVYFIGLLGGNIAWILTHPNSSIPTVGASGAVFGILGAYMACWPSDRVEFPVLFFIRPWPIWVIALVYVGFEVWVMNDQQYLAGSSVAHMAHIGGFLLSYTFARSIAKGGPHLIEGSIADEGRHSEGRIPDLGIDPWKLQGMDLEGPAARVLEKLETEGDEVETRRAWLEELSEHVLCPTCEGEIICITENGRTWIECGVSSKHLRWP